MHRLMYFSRPTSLALRHDRAYYVLILTVRSSKFWGKYSFSGVVMHVMDISYERSGFTV